MSNNNSLIQDVKIFQKKVITDDRGKILHMMRNDDSYFSKFGEIYFSYVFPKKIKAWHIHKKMTLNLCVPLGSVKFVFKTEKDSISRVETIGENDYSRIPVHPKIWFAMIGIANPNSLIINIADIKHDINEVISKSEK